MILLVSGCVTKTQNDCIKNSTGERMGFEEAVAIAKAGECGDRLKENHFCNEITGTWWMDLNIEKSGCNPACVINVANKSAEINWRCTGLLS